MTPISDIAIKMPLVYKDDRGLLMELLRQYEFDSKQTTFTESYPGVIKAFHRHKVQTDAWWFCYGNAQVVLYDGRKEKDSYGTTEVYYLDRYSGILFIPPGVWHGYRVLGNQPAGLIYHTSEVYSPYDEERRPFDDYEINFDWKTQNR